MNNKPRILFYDFETAPIQAYIWKLFKIDRVPTEMIIKDWYILCWCAKWLDVDEVYSNCLLDHPGLFKEDSTNDMGVIATLWELLDEADIVVTQNGIRFDNKKFRTKCMTHGLTPPSPWKNVDTYQIARRSFDFSSNRLDYIGKTLGVGEKVKHEGFPLWEGCMSGDPEAYEKMLDYCKGDIILLENVYKKMLPFIENHPNLNNYIKTDRPACPNCTSHSLIISKKYRTATREKIQYRCKECGHYCTLNGEMRSKDERKVQTKHSK